MHLPQGYADLFSVSFVEVDEKEKELTFMECPPLPIQINASVSPMVIPRSHILVIQLLKVPSFSLRNLPRSLPLPFLVVKTGKTSKGHPANSFPLDGQVAIVTGGSRGIGRTIALHLHSLGAKVVISYVANSNQADQLAYDLNTAANSYPVAIAVQANISELDHVKLLFDRAEQEFDIESHILVHSAGVQDSKYPIFAKATVDDWDMTFNVNSSSAFLCCREAANRLKHGGGGRIIMISTSLVGASLTGCGEYTASKAAVEAITKIMAKGLKGIGITANCVPPGAVATELFFAGKTEEIVKRLADACPLGRLGEPKDVALVGFLATDAGEWVNGGFIV